MYELNLWNSSLLWITRSPAGNRDGELGRKKGKTLILLVLPMRLTWAGCVFPLKLLPTRRLICVTLLLIPKTSSLLKRVPTGGNSSSPAGPGFPTLSTTLDYHNFNVPFASMGILADTEWMVEVTPGDKLI